LINRRAEGKNGSRDFTDNRKDNSRKGAKAQSAAAFLKDFLCAFAGEIFVPTRTLDDFLCKAS
jgi:hypothetical protein